MSDDVLQLDPVEVTAPRYRIQDPDEVIVQLADKIFTGWQTASITLSCEQIPNHFTVTASAEFLQGSGMQDTRPGQVCNVSIGKDTVITGWLDRRTITTGPRDRTVTLTGRGLTRNLVDCSADILASPEIKGGQISAKNTLELATLLSKKFNVKVRSAVTDLGLPILPFQVGLGETPWTIIESVARYAGYLVYEDTKGALVLDRLGENSMASGFTQPGNIEALAATQAEDMRYSDYWVVWYGLNGLFELSDIANQRAHASDKTMPEYRPLIQVSRQVIPAYDQGLAMANWEFARRLGRSQTAMITCDSWRDNGQKLWTPNWLASIEAPDSDITGAKWIIGTVTFRKDRSGTHADLILMPPQAFEVQPNPLNLWNNELAGVPTTRPPSTDPKDSAPPWLPGPAT